MKILAIADIESAYLWDHFDKSKLEGIDLILSCGDLSPLYLSFLATFADGPVLYVHGNHDGRYEQTPPDGCVCIEDKIYEYQGLRILGVGGSMRYHPGPHQYTQRQMDRRVFKLGGKILLKGGFDILLTHSPARGINDGEDLPHTGFNAFRRLLDRYSPRYFIHGHVHMSYNYRQPRLCTYRDTTVVNAFERFIIEL